MYKIQERKFGKIEDIENSSESKFEQDLDSNEEQINRSNADQKLKVPNGQSRDEQDVLFDKHIRMQEN